MHPHQPNKEETARLYALAKGVLLEDLQKKQATFPIKIKNNGTELFAACEGLAKGMSKPLEIDNNNEKIQGVADIGKEIEEILKPLGTKATRGKNWEKTLYEFQQYLQKCNKEIGNFVNTYNKITKDVKITNSINTITIEQAIESLQFSMNAMIGLINRMPKDMLNESLTFSKLREKINAQASALGLSRSVTNFFTKETSMVKYESFMESINGIGPSIAAACVEAKALLATAESIEHAENTAIRYFHTGSLMTQGQLSAHDGILISLAEDKAKNNNFKTKVIDNTDANQNYTAFYTAVAEYAKTNSAEVFMWQHKGVEKMSDLYRYLNTKGIISGSAWRSADITYNNPLKGGGNYGDVMTRYHKDYKGFQAYKIANAIVKTPNFHSELKSKFGAKENHLYFYNKGLVSMYDIWYSRVLNATNAAWQPESSYTVKDSKDYKAMHKQMSNWVKRNNSDIAVYWKAKHIDL